MSRRAEWQCITCAKQLSSKRSYEEHMNTHNKLRPFKCKSCDYAAASAMTLRRHVLRHHKNCEDWGYPCPHCDQTFMEPASYKQHLIVLHPGQSGTYACFALNCDLKTLSEKHFRLHMKRHAYTEIERSYFSRNCVKDGGRVKRGHFIVQSQRSFMIKKNESCDEFLVDDEVGSGFGKEPDLEKIEKLKFEKLSSAPNLTQGLVFECRPDTSAMRLQRGEVSRSHVPAYSNSVQFEETVSTSPEKTARYLIVKHCGRNINNRDLDDEIEIEQRSRLSPTLTVDHEEEIGLSTHLVTLPDGQIDFELD